jgi:hypothetical protein
MGIYGDLQKLNQAKSLSPSPAIQQPETSSSKRSGAISVRKQREPHPGTVQPRNRDTTTPRNHDTMIETIRAAVKMFGKEAATYRFTAEEKQAIGDVVYTYRGQHIRTSENEITRISVNFILVDYKVNGENSILHQVLKALNS